MADHEKENQSQDVSKSTGGVGAHTGTTGDTGVTGSGSAGSAAGGVSGTEQSRGTTSGALPTAETDTDAVGRGSTLSEGMASGAKGGMSAGTGGGDALGTGEVSDHTSSTSDRGVTSAHGGMTSRDDEETGSAAGGS